MKSIIFYFNHYIVLDFCFANIICGKHGRCVNTLSGFKCSCTFLYGGILCERSKIYFSKKKKALTFMHRCSLVIKVINEFMELKKNLSS
jgi:hypothetical protein